MSDEKVRKPRIDRSKTNLFGEKEECIPVLKDRYTVEPFNVFDTRGGEWNRRRRKWRDYLLIGSVGEEGRVGIQAEEIEINNAFSKKFNSGKGIVNVKIAEEAVFDQFLLECLFDLFCPDEGHILDPFNGSHISGAIACTLGYQFTGIDIRQKIIDQNNEKINEIIKKTPGTLLETCRPNYFCGDSKIVLDELFYNEYDLINSCPPYANLVKYSDLEGDISGLDYDDFVEAYRSIIKKCCFVLKDNCYATITIGQIRNKKTGELLPFMEDTIKAFKDCKMKHWNEVPLIGSYGSAAMRAKGTFERGKGKLVNVHQTVLIFKKC